MSSSTTHIIPRLFGYCNGIEYCERYGNIVIMIPRAIKTAISYKSIAQQLGVGHGSKPIKNNELFSTLDNIIEDLYDNREKQIADTESIENTLRKHETNVGKCREETQYVKESIC